MPFTWRLMPLLWIKHKSTNPSPQQCWSWESYPTTSHCCDKVTISVPHRPCLHFQEEPFWCALVQRSPTGSVCKWLVYGLSMEKAILLDIRWWAGKGIRALSKHRTSEELNGSLNTNLGVRHEIKKPEGHYAGSTTESRKQSSR